MKRGRLWWFYFWGLAAGVDRKWRKKVDEKGFHGRRV